MKGAIRKGLYVPVEIMISNDEEVLEEILSHKQISTNKFSMKKNSFPSRSLHICLQTDKQRKRLRLGLAKSVAPIRDGRERWRNFSPSRASGESDVIVGACPERTSSGSGVFTVAANANAPGTHVEDVALLAVNAPCHIFLEPHYRSL